MQGTAVTAVDTPAVLEALTRHIYREIPLSQHLAFQLHTRQDALLTLAAPLAPNSNDKGTMFAGSISTLSTLAGWALTGRLAADLSLDADVLAVSNSIEFLAPIRADVTVTAQADTKSLISFRERMQRRGRARLKVTVEVQVGAEVCARFEGDYLAQPRAADKR